MVRKNIKNYTNIYLFIYFDSIADKYAISY